MKSTDQSVAHTVTLISLVSLGLVDQRTFKKYIIHLPLQSKHIVIFDTLIQQSKPEEVEAVLGELLKMIF
jgi:Zn-dependent protease with chaperone function